MPLMTYRNSRMNIDRFIEIIDAYGSKPEHWPSDEREKASALLAVSEKAQHYQHQASALDALLDKTPAPELPITLQQRVIAQVAGNENLNMWQCLAQWLFGQRPYEHILRPTLMFLLPLLIGLLIGFSLPFMQDSPSLPDDIIATEENHLLALDVSTDMWE